MSLIEKKFIQDQFELFICIKDSQNPNLNMVQTKELWKDNKKKIVDLYRQVKVGKPFSPPVFLY